MVKYDKNFDSMLAAMDAYWGDHDLETFVEQMLDVEDEPQEITTSIILQSNFLTKDSFQEVLKPTKTGTIAENAWAAAA